MPRSTHPLAYLCQFFDAIEVNSSYYHPPQARHSARWVKEVEANPAFMFTAKLWKAFTHDRQTWPSAQQTQAYIDGLAPLAGSGKLGAVLVQFPWSFKRTLEARQWLARVLDTFSAYPLTVEIRHASWNRPEVYKGLAERGVAFCNIDQPLFRDSLQPTATVTAPVGYVRLHGRNAQDWFREEAGRDDRYNYLYSREELAPWLAKIDRIRAMAKDIYVITNNHYEGQAVVNAFELQSALTGKAPAPPPCLLHRYPRLRSD
jgi:uncharacterized protein YecE (DUF72 family)